MTFAEEMLERIEGVLREAAGLQSASIAGQTVTYADLLAQREHWRREIAKEQGGRPLLLEVDMRGT